MEIHVAAGVGRGPTELAAYDAALADAGVGDFNLVVVSSVVPADATVRSVETVPDLGSPGDRLTVVQAHASATPADAHDTDAVTACLGWATGPGPGLFYEAEGTDADAVRETVREGLAAGRDLREWTFDDEETRVATVETDEGAFVAAVVVAAYGEGEPIA
ncbi:pyruvoyl-dependent arginine decarboxylase [Halobaculum sp. CBA1158]|uniref:pyruvoyl-dependent arginine decarboxylase n=1 Tax=Halobaculum sp. CBA1158 TaxID=2904243 RepID=UPI001F363583|nr:pyruvoyl-dependent arginine decarboxylase [Halobaculum sp. CBA1158]UIO99613.1 pyruvoyl-dependent arginine decarboxylase [Halobaculum sp. CBA1158]